MPSCDTCKETYGMFEGSKGRCNVCRGRNLTPENYEAEQLAELHGLDETRRNAKLQREQDDAAKAAIANVMLTTEQSPAGLGIAERMGIVTAECVFGMHLFKDIFAAGRDIFGGRSAAIQTTLKDARNTALQELRVEASALGANAVIAISLDYSEISGGGKSMLFVVASGTAVRLAPTGAPHG